MMMCDVYHPMVAIGFVVMLYSLICGLLSSEPRIGGVLAGANIIGIGCFILVFFDCPI